MYPTRHSYSSQPYSSPSTRSSSSFPNSSYSHIHSQYSSFISSNSFYLPPNTSDGNSREMNLRDNKSLPFARTSSNSFLLPSGSSNGNSRKMSLGEVDSLQHIQTITTTFNSSYSHSSPSNELLNSSNSFLLPPKISGHNSRNSNFKNTNKFIRKPISNPLERFLHRSEETCPTHLNQSQRTKWLKAGEKARKNKSLLDSTEAFHWPQTNYDLPIHIHYKTSSQVIESLIQTILNINLFTIDTEADKSTYERPKPIPALIQIQAIRAENSSVVILIEVQHLPPHSSSLFLNNLIYLIYPTLLNQ